MDKEKEYPSMSLAYEWVKNILTEQAQAADALSNKAGILWVLATAIIGIIVPLSLYGGIPKLDNWSWLFGSVFFYVAIFACAIYVFYPRPINRMKNPKKLREGYWGLPEEDFIEYILKDIEKAFEDNEKILKKKKSPIPLMFVFITIETIWILAWIIYIFYASS